MADQEQKTSVIDALLEGMDTVLSAKTVVGQPTKIGDTTIIPLVDVSFGVAAGNGKDSKFSKQNGVGGMGGKMTPSAILVIQNGNTRLLSVKNQDSITKILDMIPEVVNRLSKDKKGGPTDEEIEDAAFPDATKEE